MESQDKIKLGLAILLVVAGVVGFYLLAADQAVLRVVVFVISLLAAAAVVWQSVMGKNFVAYAQESIAEARKVVWPQRKEATQLTMLVFAFVFVLALFMWLVDSSLSWLFYDVLLRRG
ncbi:preprotein translocase subunit SecE [Vogesella sp. LIG4]|uniref:preprotein translocase subunit SecE n=1 Tax=Vogesella sp. LIG4 TaxID=1192162 RepID=UPI00081FF68A|nr:preprotein translocase subunit SecE [Vogesella sp. LIG4]SCK10354.1 preprotein translocase subunit SecE [Vogesella sp. LIG4]